MVNATEFFDRPAREICQIFSQVLKIFMGHFKTFAVLALLQSLVLLPVFGGFLIVVFLACAPEILALSGLFDDDDFRRLDESSYNWNYPESEFGDGSMDSQTNVESLGLIFSLLGLFILFRATTMCIGSVFQGAFVRATGEIFAGHSPNWQTCLQIGWTKTCSIICFGFLFHSIVIVMAVIWFGITVMQSVRGKPSFVAVLSFLVFLVAYFVFNFGMTVGVTTIMVENKTAVAAIGRSWKLCNSSIYFIFCCILCFHILEFFGQTIAKQIMWAMFSVGGNDLKTAASLMAAASWIMGLLLGPLNAILNPVIYFSLRIQKEGLTMGELQRELSLLEDSIELSTRDSIYSKVGDLGDKTNSLPPIVHATVV